MYLSPDFPYLVCIAVVVLLFLLLLGMNVIYNRKSSKNLGKLATFFDNEGDEIMKNIFAKAVQGVNDELKGAPVNGNAQMLEEIFGKIYRRSKQQGFGLAQLMSAASFTEAANAQQSEMNDIIESIRAELVSESNRFDANTRVYLEKALGNPQQLVQALQNFAAAQGGDTSVSPETADASPAVHVVEVEQTATAGSGDVVAFHRAMTEDEVKVAIQAMPWLHSIFTGVGINQNNGWTWEGLPNNVIEQLLAHFRGKAATTDATSEEKCIFKFLGELKTHRSESKMRKTGWISYPYISCRQLQLIFLFFF